MQIFLQPLSSLSVKETYLLTNSDSVELLINPTFQPATWKSTEWPQGWSREVELHDLLDIHDKQNVLDTPDQLDELYEVDD